METLQTFTGTLPHGFQGNLSYHMQLPAHALSALRFVLTCQRLPAEADAGCAAHGSLTPPTAITLCLLINGEFAGFIHAPGDRAELTLPAKEAVESLHPQLQLKGTAKIILNVTQASECDLAYTLEMQGEMPEETQKKRICAKAPASARES